MSTANTRGLKKRDLFGGAIKACMPANFVDISTVRDIPDHQEIFADDSDRSIIVEILEMESSQSNEKAGLFFFEDLAAANGSTDNKVEECSPLVSTGMVPCIASSEKACANIVIGTQQVAKFRESAKNLIRVFLCNIRLPKFNTDILITLNCPIEISSGSSSAAAMDVAGLSLSSPLDAQQMDLRIFSSVLESFTILNPALFGT